MEEEEAKKRKKEKEHEYYLAHREEKIEQSRRYFKEHPEKVAMYRKNATEKRKLGLGYYQRYYQEHKEQLSEYAREYRKKHPEKIALYQHRRWLKIKAEKEAARAEKEMRKQNGSDAPSVDVEKPVAKNINVNKVKSMFRDPAAKAHLQWILEHNGNS